jgi:hypothetical protein
VFANRAASQEALRGRTSEIAMKGMVSISFGLMLVCVLTKVSLIALSNFLDFSEFLENELDGSQNEQRENRR